MNVLERPLKDHVCHNRGFISDEAAAGKMRTTLYVAPGSEESPTISATMLARMLVTAIDVARSAACVDVLCTAACVEEPREAGLDIL